VKKPEENLLSWTTFSYRFVDFLPGGRGLRNSREEGGYGLREQGVKEDDQGARVARHIT